MAMACLVQGYPGVSDAEMVQLTVVDLDVQMVLDRLGEVEPAFSQGALCDFRALMIAHDLDRDLLERTVEVARTSKAFDPKKLPKTWRIQRTNSPLYRACLLKEALADTLDRLQPGVAAMKLEDWMGWASRSKLKPFVRLSKTIRKHFDEIVACLRTRLTNSLAEGFNNKTRPTTSRAFGFHDSGALAAMICLC